MKENTGKQSPTPSLFLAGRARNLDQALELYATPGECPPFFSWHKPLERKVH